MNVNGHGVETPRGVISEALEFDTTLSVVCCRTLAVTVEDMLAKAMMNLSPDDCDVVIYNDGLQLRWKVLKRPWKGKR